MIGARHLGLSHLVRDVSRNEILNLANPLVAETSSFWG